MNLYFCEKCGRRLSDEDVQQGRGLDKKLAGIFCRSCAVGALTIETLPVDPKEAQKLLSEARSKRTTQASPAPARPASAALRRADVSPPSGARKWALAGGAAGAVVLLIVILALAANTGHGPAPARTSSEAAIERTKAPPSTGPAPPQSPPYKGGDTGGVPPVVEPAGQATTKGERKEDVPRPPPSTVQNRDTEAPKSAPAAADAETRASQAWDEVKRFDGMPPDDKAGRVAKIRAFLQEYGDTIVAARARSLLKSLEEPPPRPVEDRPKESTPGTGAHAAGAAADGQLATATFGFEEGGGSPAGWEPNNKKLQISVDTDRPHSGAHSLRLHADKSARGNVSRVVKGIRPGATYEIRAWVRSAGLTNPKSAGNVMDALFWDEGGAGLTSFDARDAQIAGGDWHEAAGRGVAPPRAAQLRLRLFLNDSAGTIWFDDVTVREVKP